MTATQDAPAARMAGAASLALFRVFIWESGEYAAALGRHLQTAGHPFVVRRRDELPQSFAKSCGAGHSGQILELFTLPIDLGAVLDTLHLEETEHDLDTVLDLSELPALLLRRKRRPADSAHPEREFCSVLQHLPTWLPDSVNADLPCADLQCAESQEIAHRDPALLAPFLGEHDDALEFVGGYRGRRR